MFKQARKLIAFRVIRNFSTTKLNNFKVTLCGAAGGVGQPTALLLKQNRLIKQLNLHDIVENMHGIAADLSHIDTTVIVCGYLGPEQLGDALDGADIVVITAGVGLKLSDTRDSIFAANAGLTRDIIAAIGDNCPKALIAIVTNPVNSLVPIAAEVLKKCGKYDPKRLFGVNTIDVMRSRTFLGEALNIDPKKVKVDVIGGHSDMTIIPVLSQSKPKFTKDAVALTKKISEGGMVVRHLKKGVGSVTLGTAYATEHLVNSLLRALNGESEVIECAYVESNITEVPYFATPLCLGKNGIEKNLGLPNLNDYEKKLLAEAIPVLKKQIKTGVDFIKKSK